MKKHYASPDPEQLNVVETTLYNRMVRNAFVGFVKSAAVGAVIGLAAGALIAAFAPQLTIAAGALKVAAWLGGVAGSFGAVAGIQSTRDTRRFFLMHESHELSPEQTTMHALLLQPNANKSTEAKAGRGEKETRSFQDMLNQSAEDKFQSPLRM